MLSNETKNKDKKTIQEIDRKYNIDRIPAKCGCVNHFIDANTKTLMSTCFSDRPVILKLQDVKGRNCQFWQWSCNTKNYQYNDKELNQIVELHRIEKMRKKLNLTRPKIIKY